MTIGLQGTWSVSVKSKSASWAQRFVIAGADSGNGTYTGVTGTPAVLVSGEQWGVTIQNNPTGPISWRPSRARLANYRVDGAFFKVDIESDDGGGFAGDEDFNDLVLTASKPLNASEWIVYGTVKTYSGRCLFNPCFPFPWVVIDSAAQLERLLGYSEMRAILEREYGSDVAALAKKDNFRPMMLSRGGSSRGGYQVRGKTKVELTKGTKNKKAALKTTATADIVAADRFDYRGNLSPVDASIIDKLIPARRCSVEPLGQALMRFVEYDRTDSELGGGTYTGLGDHEILGVSATDEFGNYVYSFTRSFADLFDDSTGDTPIGGDPVVSANPDLIIQFPEVPDGVATYETAPHYDIPNVRRIDLCVRKSAFTPKPCRGGGVLQYLGDIPIVNNSGSTLHSDGTITNIRALSVTGPNITRGAWRGTVEFRGCFEDSQDPVTHYTIKYRVNDPSWEYLDIDVSGLRVQLNGVYERESWGADATALSVGEVPAYRNIALEDGWSIETDHLLARISLDSLLNTVPLERRVANMWFQIQGYDASGDPVPGTIQEEMLRVDDQPTIGDIASIVVPGETGPDDCALLNLPSDTTPLEVRLRAIDPDGFMQSWSLTATRGSNKTVGLTDVATAAPPRGSYPGATVDDRYDGTSERLDADIDGYVTIRVTPEVGWLGDEEFCAYSFELSVQDRTTDGKRAASPHEVHDEVVGMRPDDM
ncbi:MAG: hypothetical protein ACN4GZ_14345 [Acidimicrobiales bacterium]